MYDSKDLNFYNDSHSSITVTTKLTDSFTLPDFPGEKDLQDKASSL